MEVLTWRIILPVILQGTNAMVISWLVTGNKSVGTSVRPASLIYHWRINVVAGMHPQPIRAAPSMLSFIGIYFFFFLLSWFTLSDTFHRENIMNQLVPISHLISLRSHPTDGLWQPGGRSLFHTRSVTFHIHFKLLTAKNHQSHWNEPAGWNFTPRT